MLCFFREFYELLSQDLIIEWASRNNLKLKPSYLTIDYYRAISDKINCLIESHENQNTNFSFFGLSDAKYEYDYCIIIDYHFYLYLFKFERRDYELIGPISTIVHAHTSIESFKYVPNSSWMKFLCSKWGDSFLRCYMFSKVRPLHVEQYIEDSHIVLDEKVHIKDLIISDYFRVYFFMDSQGYEYRIEINSSMDFYVRRTRIKLSEYNHNRPNTPKFYFIRGEMSFYDFFKNTIMGINGGDCA